MPVYDYVLDNGLSKITSEADRLYICDSEPTTFAEVISKALGAKNFGAGGVAGAPADATPNGRKVTTNAVTDGVGSAGGSVTWWAVVDFANSRLHATGTVTAFTIANGQQFTLNPQDIRIPDRSAS